MTGELDNGRIKATRWQPRVSHIDQASAHVVEHLPQAFVCQGGQTITSHRAEGNTHIPSPALDGSTAGHISHLAWLIPKALQHCSTWKRICCQNYAYRYVVARMLRTCNCMHRIASKYTRICKQNAAPSLSLFLRRLGSNNEQCTWLVQPENFYHIICKQTQPYKSHTHTLCII